MKSLLFLLIVIPASLFSQSGKTADLLNDVGEYVIDDNGYVTWTRIIEADSLSGDVLFNRAQEYFTYNYGDGESVIQINDRQSGRVIGKGLYKKTSVVSNLVSNKTDTWHILRIDTKDGKAKISISLVSYDLTITGTNGSSSDYNYMVSECYPIKEKGTYKNVYGQAFAESYKRAMASMDELEKSLKGGESDW
jgi:hypothetical protein